MDFLILLILATSAFIATNLDDIFLLAAFFSNNTFSTTNIVLGQYLGLSILILISIIASFIHLIVPSSVISLLGFLPVIIGIKNLWEIKKDKSNIGTLAQSPQKNSSSIMQVSLVTMANGGDNLGVYIPLLANLNPSDITVVVLTFLVLTGAWCLLSYKIVNNRFIERKIRTYGHIILPFVLIGIGIFIILRGGGLSL
ncbi:MAG TPA: cadmium resistance transporter [Methanobacteriaceae archaeon]|nr:cadmium resistance transporter [Methanobacteriaceae archaeon]